MDIRNYVKSVIKIEKNSQLILNNGKKSSSNSKSIYKKNNTVELRQVVSATDVKAKRQLPLFVVTWVSLYFPIRHSLILVSVK